MSIDHRLHEYMGTSSKFAQHFCLLFVKTRLTYGADAKRLVPVSTNEVGSQSVLRFA